ncbi:hypothetical protein AVEN_261143-1 [Araneus ventricosus]|uniref:SWIM-type domain-containing protein n=1 Tax=Araneus ventricosus TaxID=182803 RepID=A0A4Y2J2B5_ARAVE|nr:hypothetical protein AVEN_261143-1 [Araneus ventricosus]
MRKRAIDSANPIKQEHVKNEFNECQFSVLCGNEMHCVDVLSACCSCSAGRLGKLCKHQFAIYYYHNVCGKNFPPFHAKENHHMAYLALGQEDPQIDFYQPFRLDSCEISNIDRKDESIDEISPSTFESLLTTVSHSSESNLSIQIEKNSHKKELQEKLFRLIGDGLKNFILQNKDLQLGDKRPSHLLSEMQNLAPAKMKDDILQTLWLQRLLANLQQILSVCKASLDEFAQIADKIYEVSGCNLTVARGESKPDQVELDAIKAELADLKNMVKKSSVSQYSHAELNLEGDL